MSTPAPTPKPRKGRPVTEADHAAVAVMEARVCDLRRQRKTFVQIEEELGITNADRVYARAILQRPLESREAAFRMEVEEVNDLREQAREVSQMDPEKGIPLRLSVHDRAAKLWGTGHADRVADARLDLDRTVVEAMGVTLAESLGLVDSLSVEDKRAIIAGFTARMKALDAGDS